MSGYECMRVRVSRVDGLVYLPLSRGSLSGGLYPLVSFASFILLGLAFSSRYFIFVSIAEQCFVCLVWYGSLVSGLPCRATVSGRVELGVLLESYSNCLFQHGRFV